VIIRAEDNLASSGDNGHDKDGDEHAASEGETCAICLVDYQDGDEVCWSRNSSCGHAFHRDCIIEWLLTGTHDYCPICRRSYLSFSSEDGSGLDTANEARNENEMPPELVFRAEESQLGRGLRLFSQFANESPPSPPQPSLSLRSASSDIENSHGHDNRADSNLGRSQSASEM
jgi:hypothetical protein